MDLAKNFILIYDSFSNKNKIVLKFIFEIKKIFKFPYLDFKSI
jgi:hypothetical protein